MCLVISAGKKKIISSKVDVKIYCLISKVSFPEKGPAFQILAWPGGGWNLPSSVTSLF